MIRLFRRMNKNLDRIPSHVFVIGCMMPPLAMIIGAWDVVAVWTVFMWGMLIYLIVKRPVEDS